MRIIIESHELAESKLQMVSEASSVEAQNAGEPPEELFRHGERRISELTLAPETLSAMDAGPPTQWLQEAIEATVLAGVDTMTAEAHDGGSAPTLEG